MSRHASCRLVDRDTGSVVTARLEVPRSMLGRGLGLMFRSRVEPDAGMWINPGNGIHMFGMRFAIDAVFLDRDLRVVRIISNLRPWRVVPLVRRARSVVELPAGGAAEAGLRVGSALAVVAETEA